jgi:uncharacterized membrane protein YqjE
MIDNESTTERLHPQTFSDALKCALAALSAALHTRLQLFAVELEEERERLKQTVILTFLVVFGLSLGFIIFIIFLVALFLANGWIAALGCLALLFLCIGTIAALMLRKQFLTRPGIFTATLAELAKDRDRVRAAAHE